jgi:PiT family inorganic phosphate transporter
LNDTPKIAGLLVGAQAMSAGPGTAALASAMALGGLLAARRVARTLAFGITGMNSSEGLSANLVTAGLVVLASPLGLPVSTTHVSCGALFGIGVINGQGRGQTMSTIIGAWVTTLPVAGVLSALVAAGFTAIQ